MFSFLPLINNPINIGLSFLLLSISGIISSNKSIFCVLYLDNTSKVSSVSFDYLIKAVQSLIYLKPKFYCLLIKNWCLLHLDIGIHINFNNI